tara:strand:+ start:134 stop:550 length:417 start_codon:yes stop_codon:yes gene_type:complete
MKEEHGWRHGGRRGLLADGFQGGVVRFIAQVSTRIGGDGIRHGEGCRVPQREVQPATARTQTVEVHVVHLTAQVIGDPHVQTVPSDSLQPRSITGFTQTNMKNSIPTAPLPKALSGSLCTVGINGQHINFDMDGKGLI